ncbi:MAG: electron transfer flavoprotein subunit alpha/FixB family protein [Chloroflexaceae bacterium]|nr:electron transfer flavoprotein subunit alpha/FixB family protein [Chloroflexaceae bacterium]
MPGVWVFIETVNDDVAAISRELLGKGRELADAMGQQLGALIVGGKAGSLAQRAFAFGADVACVVEDSSLSQYTTDGYVAGAVAAIKEYNPELLLTGSSFQMRDFAAALAAELGVGVAVDATGVSIEGGQITATRPSHGGNVINSITFSGARPAIVAARKQSFAEAKEQPGRTGTLLQAALPATDIRTQVTNVTPKSGVVNLTDAAIIVTGGRGLSNPENYQKLIPPLAKALGGAYGASRAIVDAGWIPYEHQVGQTGKTVSPKLYVACGVSGAIQHLAGMRTSRNIVAINKDAEAPIFRVATFGVVGDVNEILPLLTDELNRRLSR